MILDEHFFCNQISQFKKLDICHLTFMSMLYYAEDDLTIPHQKKKKKAKNPTCSIRFVLSFSSIYGLDKHFT